MDGAKEMMEQQLMTAQIRVCDLDLDKILQHPDVTGMGICLAEDGASYAFIVYVRENTPAVRKAIPRVVDGVPVRVFESGEFVPF